VITELRHRHVELVAVGVFEVQELGLAFAQVHVHQAHVAADAVAGVHHRVAGLELGQVAQPAFHGGGLAAVAAGAAAGGGGVELGFGDDGEAGLGQHEAGGEGPVPSASRPSPATKASKSAWRGLEGVFGEVLGDGLLATGGFGEHQHAAREARAEGLEAVERVAGLALDGHVGQRLGGPPGRRPAGPGGGAP
jgi:hypothetical protein